MGELHDDLSTFYGNQILNGIRTKDNDFKQIFSPSIIRIGDWDWPRPDYVCFDEELKATYALEFKPPFQSKREYLTGLGQSLAYLQKHTYSGLIIPHIADDGFPIAKFVADTLNSAEFINVGTSLYEYDFNSNTIRLLRPILNQRENFSEIRQNKVETFWCWWRDMSHYELYDLLNLSFIYSDESGDIYTNKIYPMFYKKMINGHTKQWNGMPRNKKVTEESYRSEKQNYKIPLVQLDLWGRDECRLTNTGLKLLEIGKKYGPDSKIFKYCLAYLILVKGKHLELIKLVDKFQEIQKKDGVPSLQKDYIKLLDEFLTNNGCIGKRKPTAVTTDAKNGYIRDEIKLWNKFGLLRPASASRVFHSGIGYKFDWNKITSILIYDNQL